MIEKINKISKYNQPDELEYDEIVIEETIVHRKDKSKDFLGTINSKKTKIEAELNHPYFSDSLPVSSDNIH